MLTLGQNCKIDLDCLANLQCGLDPSEISPPRRICQCQHGFSWTNENCVIQGREGQNDVADFITIFVPVIVAVFATLIIVASCCCWIHSSTKLIQSDMKKATKAKYPDEDLFDFELESQGPFKSPEKPLPRPKNDELVIKISDNGEPLRPQRPLGTLDLPQEQGKISDLGYQSNMRLLFDRPLSPMAFSGEARPHSANFFNLDSRPGSAALNGAAKSRASSANSSRKSSAINGPYLTKTLKATSRPTSAKLQNGQALYDKIVAVAEASEENKGQDTSDNLPRPPEPKGKAKKKKNRHYKSEAIEEIRLVRVAVNAFKKKRRLRDLKKKKKAKKATFESVVEKVMRMRDEEKRTTYTITHQRSSESNTTMSSSLSSSSSSLKSKRPRRPESVAQRVLRERKEKNISAKAPKSAPLVKKDKKITQKVPLHMALRQSSSKERDRAQISEKIKHEAHFRLLKNFEVIFYERYCYSLVLIL